MPIPQAEFQQSGTGPQHYPKDDLPEIAVVGRSNVGKSSLLNALMHRRNLAHTSSTPGKTRLVNFFLIDKRYRLVDLPGYGYAKVSKTDRAVWGKMIEEYLLNRPNLRLVVSLIDIRHEPTALDRDLLAWLEETDHPYVVILTKSDKVKKGEVEKRLKEMKELTAGHTKLVDVLTFSTDEKEKAEKTLRMLAKLAKVY